MEGLIRWWVRNPVAANLLMLIIVTAGWLGLRDIEKEAFPSVQPDIVQVEIIWPGASPKEVEQQVIQRVEEVLKDVPNVYRVTSEARESFGSLTVESFKIHERAPEPPLSPGDALYVPGERRRTCNATLPVEPSPAAPRAWITGGPSEVAHSQT